MTRQETLPRTEAGTSAPPERPEAVLPDGSRVDDPESPWYGIPAELLDGASYDKDTAGGCG
jgi:hypothetical protein